MLAFVRSHTQSVVRQPPTFSVAIDESMILTALEVIATRRQEVRILLHLAGKIEGPILGYRPTPKQRTLELLQYMTIMGPMQLTVIEHGVFDRPALSSTWSPAEAEAKGMSCSCISKRAELSTMSLWAGADMPAKA